MEFEKLQKIISEVLNVDAEEITMETTFVDDLGADSLDVFQILMGIEEEFDIEIPAEKAEKISTVEEAVELRKNNIKCKILMLSSTGVKEDISTLINVLRNVFSYIIMVYGF